jgi:transcriptional regulator GlxA family with amidase domain
MRPAPQGFLAALSDSRLSRAVKIMHEGAGRAITLAEIAQGAGMSRSALAERFKSALGTSPIDYLTKWRMLTACNLLQDSRLPIGEVARRVGYESDVTFARAFRRELGSSPAQYRRGAS